MRVSGLIRGAAPACVAAIVLSSCASGPGVTHRVEEGQSLRRIAKAYGVSPEEILSANGLREPASVRSGRELRIPGARETARVPSFEEFRELVLRPHLREGIAWPVEGTVSSDFGGRGKGRHSGLDILAGEGSPVRAALTGIVIHRGDSLRGYGNAIVLDHGEGVTTLYGHLREFRVESGDAVPRGSVIGTVGRTGNASTSHLHFELRVEDEPVDPLRYLARRPGGTR